MVKKMIFRKIKAFITFAKIAISKIWLPANNVRISQVEVNGLQLIVLANEDVGRELAFGGQYEIRDTQALKKLILPTDVCVDVGANVGYYTTLMSGLAYNGSVHAFEPVPINWMILNLNIQLNRLKNVVLNFKALADKRGVVDFSISVDGAYSSIKHTERHAESEIVSVELDTLDAYIASNKLLKIDVIKVDVEGAEELVLKGGRELFVNMSMRPRLLVLELFDSNLEKFEADVDAVLMRMKNWGYVAKVANHTGELIPYDGVMKNRICNIFFTN